MTQNTINTGSQHFSNRETFLYGLLFLGYNYMTVAWQGNLTTTTVALEKCQTIEGGGGGG